VDSLPPLATSPPTWIPLLQLDLLGRLVLAAVLGGIVGVERVVHDLLARPGVHRMIREG
jgi:hypothetical protein